MNKLKKVFTVLVLISLIFVLTACGEKTNNDDNKNTSGNTTSNNNINEQGGTEGMKKAKEFVAEVQKLESDKILENAEKQMEEPKEGDTIAIFHIDGYGDIKIKFFEDVAPKACENFITHAKEGYYDGVIFHRVINEFMIQGGDPEGTGYGGESIWNKGFDEELNSTILPYRGALCMASSGTGTTSLGSQFFIVQAHYEEAMNAYLEDAGLNTIVKAFEKYEGSLYNLIAYGQYTTFGQVIEGMDIVDEIASVETDSRNNKPVQDIVISSVEITNYSK